MPLKTSSIFTAFLEAITGTYWDELQYFRPVNLRLVSEVELVRRSQGSAVSSPPSFPSLPSKVSVFFPASTLTTPGNCTIHLVFLSSLSILTGFWSAPRFTVTSIPDDLR
eukprot:CAMPEP_0118672254 /NCGR_PEP_ID=MMETSP0785-20121206/22440_1 /TAXON_ID=91992 /ORGANISM="Bolidomonas pacifica, Strain CCMP 1866" /LENGTH=109 /DNA_ID=CAMNT_0006567199 /DNA_START=80 /DNA_END=409 /DNA_ORIENTATION=-